MHSPGIHFYFGDTVSLNEDIQRKSPFVPKLVFAISRRIRMCRDINDGIWSGLIEFFWQNNLANESWPLIGCYRSAPLCSVPAPAVSCFVWFGRSNGEPLFLCTRNARAGECYQRFIEKFPRKGPIKIRDPMMFSSISSSPQSK